MVSVSIYIQENIEIVWDQVILEFAKAFKTSPSKVGDKVLKTTTDRGKGVKVDIEQKIEIIKPFEEFTLITTSDMDFLTSTYKFEEDDDGTFLTITETASGNKGGWRSFAFKIAMMPGFNHSYKKRLQYRLEAIKAYVEGELADETKEE